MPLFFTERIPALCLSWVLVGCMLFNGWVLQAESQATAPKPKAQDRQLPAEPQTLNPGEKHTYSLTLKANNWSLSNRGLMWWCGWLVQMETSWPK